MSRIQVTPERLFEAAREVEDAREQMEDTREELVRLIRWMESMWSGMVRERFLERFEENQPRMIDTLESLAHIAKELREIGVRFQQADEVSGAAVAGNVATKSIGLKATSTTKGLEDKNQVGLQGYDASCVPPPPDACRTPVADTRNVFQKSLDSLLELGAAFMQSADDRYQKRYDSVGGFLDYWTFGIPSGLVEEYVDRANKAFDSPNDTANWLTFGIHGTIRESIFPANAWSSEHWANMMGLGGMMVGGGITAKMIKPHNLLTSSGGGIKLDASSRPPGSGPMAGGFNGYKDPRLQVMDNIAESKKARESSKFSEFAEKEKRRVEGTGDVNLTEPSLPKGGKPKGNYTKGDSHGIKKESETADLMADQGYDIEMLDEVNGGNGYGIKESSNPDFLIEGKVFDCYAPTIETNVDNILRNITKKTKTQAERIVLNLDQFPSEKVAEIIQGILRKANPNGDLKNIKELLIVKNGEITRVFGG
ncbi:WXG100 family type VII secretion target [Paenibacillus barcinonensis]|nr:WXG100 family type VII secretion target [Paenibacillus barcinonensis]